MSKYSLSDKKNLQENIIQDIIKALSPLLEILNNIHKDNVSCIIEKDNNNDGEYNVYFAPVDTEYENIGITFHLPLIIDNGLFVYTKPNHKVIDTKYVLTNNVINDTRDVHRIVNENYGMLLDLSKNYYIYSLLEEGIEGIMDEDNNGIKKIEIINEVFDRVGI